MSLEIVFDDTAAAPAGVRTLIGSDRFGELVFQRSSQHDAMAARAIEAGAGFYAMRSDADADLLLERLKHGDWDSFVLFCPSHVVSTDNRENLVTFLKQIHYTPANLLMPLPGAQAFGWLLMRAPLAAKFLARAREGDAAGFLDQHRDEFVEVRDRLHLVDVSNERTLLDLLSGHFDMRHFNLMEAEEFVVTKRSNDREKLKREFEFYRLAPPEMQMFMVQPFDFRDDGRTASYRMERLLIPDMALQWVNGAFHEEEFARFLARIFHFIQSRPEKTVSVEIAERTKRALYIDKVRERIEAFKRLESYARFAPLLEQACGGIDALAARYYAMYEAAHQRQSERRLAIGHGDPCFSNILYAKSNQVMKLIDPRGAASEEELYTDRYYDVAKLSHSVLGGYDFINHGKFEVAVDGALNLRLALECPPRPWAGRLFRAHVERAGYDVKLMRLYEASLFISMLPLHADRPRHVLGFACNAVKILDELSQKGAA